MKKFFRFLLCCLFALSCVRVWAADVVCLAYCPYYASQLPDPAIVTHINYAFAEVIVRDGVYESFALQGDEAKFRQVVALKNQNPDLKISLSFSHTVVRADNYQDGGFSAIAASPQARAKFADDCLAFIRQWGIDGIDLDWEFPGISWSGAASDEKTDTQNHVLLLKQLRQTLGDEYLITFAGYVMDRRKTEGGYRYIDITASLPFVDFINIMTYDMDEAPHFHSALRSPKSYWDCVRAVNAYVEAGCPYEKMVLGIPFYLRHSFDGVTTAIDYRNFAALRRNANFVFDIWDDEACTPYATYKGEFYGSYDNQQSIAIKAQWAASLGMKGMLYWDCGADDQQRTLSNAVWNSLLECYGND